MKTPRVILILLTALAVASGPALAGMPADCCLQAAGASATPASQDNASLACGHTCCQSPATPAPKSDCCTAACEQSPVGECACKFDAPPASTTPERPHTPPAGDELLAAVAFPPLSIEHGLRGLITVARPGLDVPIAPPLRVLHCSWLN